VIVLKKGRTIPRQTEFGSWVAVADAHRAAVLFPSLVEKLALGTLCNAELNDTVDGVELMKRSTTFEVSLRCKDANEELGLALKRHVDNTDDVGFQQHSTQRRNSFSASSDSKDAEGARITDVAQSAKEAKAPWGSRPNSKSPKLPIKPELAGELPDEVSDKIDLDNIGGINAKTAIAMQGRWAIWYDYSKAGMTEDEYRNNLRMLSGFKTTDEFSRIWHTIDLQRLKYSANVRIFRAGILPFWMAKRNVHGGQFSIRLQGSEEGKAAVFERVMEMLINNEFVDCGKLNGVCFGKRGEKQHIKIWSSTVQMATQMIVDQLQDVCEEHSQKHMKITFISFKDLNAEKIAQANVDGFLVDEEPADTSILYESPAPRGKAATIRTTGRNQIAENTTNVNQQHQAAGLAIFIGLALLLGLLFNDLVFDVAPLPICRAYYCALLDSLTRFPHLLRILVPVLLCGAGLSFRIVNGTRALSKVNDIATAILLGIGATVAFYNTTSLAGDMCTADLTSNNMDSIGAMRDQLIPWHLFHGGAVLSALGLQIVEWRSMFKLKAA